MRSDFENTPELDECFTLDLPALPWFLPYHTTGLAAHVNRGDPTTRRFGYGHGTSTGALKGY
jgi:hypothetical protein